MGKTQKVKRVGSVLVLIDIVSSSAAKSNYACFLRMQLQIKLGKSLSHCLLYVLGIIKTLNHTNKIISISYQMTSSLNLRLDFLLEP
jgi:hypothetical protein